VTVTRRDFVKSGLATITMAAFTPKLRAALLPGDGAHNLIIIQLIGANDTLNTFIPYTDPLYRSMRPNLAIPEASLLPVDSAIAFHPALSGLRSLYLEKKLAIVPHVGFPSLDRSHFRCEDVWMTANEDPDSESRGWIGRWADLYATDPHSPVLDVGFVSSTPRGLVASRVGPTCLTDLSKFKIDHGTSDAAEGALFEATVRSYYERRKSVAATEAIREAGVTAFSAMDLLATLPPSPIASYPSTSLGSALASVARILTQNIGSHIFWVTLGGFDTHANQVKSSSAGGALAGDHATLLADLSQSLTTFQKDIEARGLADRTIVFAWSEFGRRVSENASLGTDHGKAGSAFLIGNRIDGGILGDPYDLKDLDDGDLRPHVDFRSLYQTLIREWLGGDPEAVLGKRFENLEFFKPLERRRAATR